MQTSTSCHLYGLKQSARAWNKKFVECLIKFNLRAIDADPCVFVNKDKEKTLILAVYIDDGLIASTDNLKIKDLLLHLSNELEVTSKPLELFLGIEFKYFSDSFVQTNQSKYAKRVVNRFRMNEAHPVAIPVNHQDLSLETPSNQSEIVNAPYKEAVGSSLYLTMVYRPDIAYAVNTVS
ncbi:integrase core domain protein [Lasius niger]|uniref:Integrase core domain protein n=1 Tax=Lasius niger TaxID=67767 RepID=A0A0J7JU87_LASNI|nr:integrase core domain protein [Lasius niger]